MSRYWQTGSLEANGVDDTLIRHATVDSSNATYTEFYNKHTLKSTDRQT